jgi:hypothetical protein
MKKALGLALFLIPVALLAAPGSPPFAVEQEHHEPAEAAELHLSDDLKALLNQEMREIEAGMMEMIPAISAGDWEVIAQVARKIDESFIMKQALTEPQLEELHHALPAKFVALDEYFHSTAGKLAEAAHRRDGELVNFYYYQLHSQCMTCHVGYASERFPDLGEGANDGPAHH